MSASIQISLPLRTIALVQRNEMSLDRLLESMNADANIERRVLSTVGRDVLSVVKSLPYYITPKGVDELSVQSANISISSNGIPTPATSSSEFPHTITFTIRDSMSTEHLLEMDSMATVGDMIRTYANKQNGDDFDDFVFDILGSGIIDASDFCASSTLQEVGIDNGILVTVMNKSRIICVHFDFEDCPEAIQMPETGTMQELADEFAAQRGVDIEALDLSLNGDHNHIHRDDYHETISRYGIQDQDHIVVTHRSIGIEVFDSMGRMSGVNVQVRGCVHDIIETYVRKTQLDRFDLRLAYRGVSISSTYLASYTLIELGMSDDPIVNVALDQPTSALAEPDIESIPESMELSWGVTTAEPSTRLFMTGIGTDVDVSKLEWLFSVRGTVKQVEVTSDHSGSAPAAFGFIEMSSIGEAGDAISQMHGTQLFADGSVVGLYYCTGQLSGDTAYPESPDAADDSSDCHSAMY